MYTVKYTNLKQILNLQYLTLQVIELEQLIDPNMFFEKFRSFEECRSVETWNSIYWVLCLCCVKNVTVKLFCEFSEL